MKKLLAFLILLICFSNTFGQKVLRTLPNKSFIPGEYLKYNVYYGFIDGGTVEMEVKKDGKAFGNRNTYHIVGTGKTKGTLDWFFKIRDYYETYLDQDAILPLLFIRRVQEGKYRKNENVIFNHYQNLAVSESGSVSIPENCQDILSAYYYSRCLNVTNIKAGDIIPIMAFIDNEPTPFHLKFVGKETVKTKKGSFRCMKFKPQLQLGRVFTEQEGMTIWISDDDNHIPIRLEAKLLVGAVKMDIDDYRGLANPFNSKLE